MFAIVSFAYLYASGKSLIWNGDGLTQHYNFFRYIGEWVREGIMSGSFSMWNYSLGYGSDTICTLASWIGDPFNIFSVICPTAWSEYMYQFVTILRLFLAGVAFSVFCRYHRRDGFATLIGALAFAFCGFCISAGAVRHPIFINAAILLPFVLTGADRIFDGKRSTMFLIAIALTFINYFYFAYMICIFLLLFCVMRYFMGSRRRSIRDFSGLVGKFVLYTVTGALVAGILLVPIVSYVLQMGRLEADVAVPVIYQLGYYLLFQPSIAGADGAWRCVSMEAVAGFFLMMLFLADCCRRRPELRQVKVAFIVMTVFVLVPFFGHVLNGFSYPTDRWMFAYAMCISYAMVLTIPLFGELTTADWKRIFIATGIFEAWMAVCLYLWYNHVWYVLAMILMAVVVLALYIVWRRCYSPAPAPTSPSDGRNSLQRVRPLRVTLLVLLIAGVGMLSTMQVATRELPSDKKTYLNQMTAFGQAAATLTTASPSYMVAQLDQTTPARYDKATETVKRNGNVTLGLYGVDFYTSVYNQRVSDFRAQLALPLDSKLQSHLYYSSDSRAALEELSGVRYFLVDTKNADVLPYGFTESVATKTVGDKDFELYATDSFLPLAFVYDSAISTSDYAGMSPIQRQEALLEGCVVDGTDIPSTQVDTTSSTLPFTIDPSSSTAVVQTADGSTLEGSDPQTGDLSDCRIVCTDDNSTLTLDFTGQPDSETYVFLNNLDFQQYRPSQLAALRSDGTLSRAARLRYWVADNKTEDARTYSLVFAGGAIDKKTITCDTPYSAFYAGRHDWLVNLGYEEQAPGSITITFKEAGEYTLDDLQVLAQPTEALDSQVAALRRTPVENLTLGEDEITGDVSMTGNGLLYLSIPYSTGWTATVDGQPADIRCANTAFMALELGTGEHSFQLEYETPGLRTGAIVSLSGILLMLAIICFESHRYRRKDATPRRPA